jgi:hypothetical protein
MANFCIGCKSNFPDQRAFGSHKRYCKTKIREEGRRLLRLKADKKRHPSEGIHDGREDGPSGYQPTAEEEMTVDQVGLSKCSKYLSRKTHLFRIE